MTLKYCDINPIIEPKNIEPLLDDFRILGTFNRSTAIKREDLLFYAPGDPVFNSIIGNAIDSGRGRCCAFSALAPFNYRGFVCVYNVEPKINHLIENKFHQSFLFLIN